MKSINIIKQFLDLDEKYKKLKKESLKYIFELEGAQKRIRQLCLSSKEEIEIISKFSTKAELNVATLRITYLDTLKKKKLKKVGY